MKETEKKIPTLTGRQCPSWKHETPPIHHPSGSCPRCRLLTRPRCQQPMCKIMSSACRWRQNGRRTISCIESHVRRFCSSIFMTPLAWKFPRIVLFGREKMIRFIPSNSSNFTGGGGSMGTSRTTDDSTWGGGRKSFLFTLMILSTLA